MATLRDLDSLVGQRLRMRDLRVFLAVVQTGSMARAAAQLGVSQPAVSAVIASLEYALKVQLLDRGPKGVELNRYGSRSCTGRTQRSTSSTRRCAISTALPIRGRVTCASAAPSRSPVR